MADWLSWVDSSGGEAVCIFLLAPFFFLSFKNEYLKLIYFSFLRSGIKPTLTNSI